jgi:uncharacterized protein (DUF2147 family)
MRKLFLLFIILSSLKSFSQKEADAIIGKWINVPKQNTIIEVYKFNNEYRGKIAWTKTPDKRKPIGYLILQKLEYNPVRKFWENGVVKEPNSGITYDATAKIKPDGVLEVHGYLGFKFLGKRKNFRKVK